MKNNTLKNILNDFHNLANNLSDKEKLLLYSYEDFIVDTVFGFYDKNSNKIMQRWNKLSQFIKHLLWVFLWKIKYILFANSKNEVILFLSMHNVKSSFDLIEVLSRNYIVFLVGAIENKKLLMNKKVFCIVNTSIKNTNELDNTFENITNIVFDLLKKYNIEVNYLTKVRKDNHYNLFVKCKKLITSIQKNLILFITDSYFPISYFSQYIIFDRNFSKVMIDHGLIFYNELYQNIVADYYFAFGKFSLDKINGAKQKFIVGCPQKNYLVKNIKKEKNKYFLYILSPYLFSFARTEGRNLEYLKKYLVKLSEVIKNNYPDWKLVLRAHPSDEIKKLKSYLNNFEFYQGNLNKILSQTYCIFAEDTSLTIDLLRYDIPLIYPLDEFDCEHIHFSKFNYNIGLGYAEISKNEIEKKIYLNSENFEKRKDIYEYYYQPFDKQKFLRLINEAIKSNCNSCNIQ
ncbi:MAG TPA: hypothetical protein PLI27_00945 [Ignavibacteriales bacterium]|nr:hypothetical protein [Ignavibacteriales bacterium]HOM64534.1 hypothetical protein [Ignavibacteriales bacterium]HPD66631.1 hypothetical protein [Ignavibacteriales bacterium]HPP32442.1 hypothetical protein [Ignavibacteriales bacterium]HRR17589.1 hypothetical protein [Ignavibacteriales bacterium]